MAWQDREYNQLGYHDLGIGPVRRPPSAALGLIVLHVVAFALVQMFGGQARSGAAAFLSFVGGAPHVTAIALHPFGMTDSITRDLFSVLFVVFVIWSLGGMVQQRLGTGPMLAMYVLGNLLAGAVYYMLASNSPRLATAPLVTPAGAMAAWAMTAWLRFNDDRVSVLSWVVTTGKFVGVAAAVIIGLRFLMYGPGATAWIAATIAGGVTSYAADWFASVHVPHITFRRSQPAAPRGPLVDEAEIDRILAKISREGIGSLSESERDTLEQARRAKQRTARK